MNGFLQDIRYALRSFRRNPAFAATAILTLALGIGATTAVFSFVNGILLRALPAPEPSRIVFITRSGDVSIPDGRDWRASAPALGSVGLFLRDWDLDLTGLGEPERLRSAVVEAQYFRVLGIAPLVGRTIEPADDQSGGRRVAVIREAFWNRRFRRDPAIVGKVISLSDHPTTIIGVMPDAFDVLGDGTDVWVPAAVETPWALGERGTNNFDAIGRLAPGASLATAKAQLRSVCERLERQFPATNQGKVVEPILLLDFLTGAVRRGILVLFAAVAFVMLIGCVNLASLLLARLASRGPELAVRRALGAGSARIFRQLIVEAEVLSLGGALLGVPIAAAGTRMLLRLAPASLPRSGGVALDLPVLAFDFGAALLAGLACAAIPVWRSRRADLFAPAGGGRQAGSLRRSGSLGWIIASEIALAVPLVVGAQLLTRSFLGLNRVPLGFEPRGALTAELVLPESRYSDRAAQTRAFRRIVGELSATPGIESAASVIGAPLRPSGRGIGSSIDVAGAAPDRSGRAPSARVRPVLGDYFRALRIPVLRGRVLRDADDENHEPVAVVNLALARRYWPGQEAVGKTIRLSGWDDPRSFRVVGLVADTKPSDLTEEDTRAVYIPYAQRAPAWQRFGTIVVRAARGATNLLPRIREAIWRVDPSLTISEIEPLDLQFRRSLAPSRFLAQVLGGFAAAALLLAAQGLYGVLAYSVVLRRKEIGVRIALGATRGRVISHIARRAALPVAAGLGAGVAAAFLARRVLGNLLFGVSSSDPATYALAAAALLLLAATASSLPALRASRIDPMTALRED